MHAAEGDSPVAAGENRPSFMNEWLATNGIGGYAMGGATADGTAMNRRRYHGLLVVAASPPVGRVVALHSVVDEVTPAPPDPPLATALATQQFAPVEAPVTHPNGWQQLHKLDVALPREIRWTYTAGTARITRTLQLVANRNAAELTWASDQSSGTLRGRVLTPMRDFHSLSSQHESPPPAELLDERTLRVIRWDLELRLVLSRGRWNLDPQWWRDFYYHEDHLRGQECTEDVWSPGDFEAPLNEPVKLHVELVEPRHAAPAGAANVATAGAGDVEQRLKLAAQQFVVQRRMGETGWSTSVIAGYPWFADWGRDTMISLPGLLLCTGCFEQAEAALLTFARHLHHGLVPNRFDDYGGAAHYNTVDASLWFVHAVHCLHEHRRGQAQDELIAACRSIIDAYRRGTDDEIHMDEDGLIAAGSAETQLTWMDARRDGITFTPRHGKAVEINALWHHGLCCLAAMTNDASEASQLKALAKRVAQAFEAQFWNESRGCCYDVLAPGSEPGSWAADDAVRPNQIFAVSLQYSPLGRPKQREVVQAVGAALLTPFGLRTLEPGHAAYCGRFEGDLMQRDAAYHQGTVWPWLIGPYAEAVLRVGEFSDQARREARQVIEPLLGELDRGCFGQLAEVYDGDEPHRPSGCPAQAWSVAEVLRVLQLCRREVH